MKNQITSFSGEYEFLSNFYPAEIFWDGGVYPSVEHAYQAVKTLNPIERIAIGRASTPGKAKRLGQKCTLRRDWEEIKLLSMELFVRQKFNLWYPHLQEKLLSTGTAELIEGNTWGDTYWGVCNGEGQNNLGKILMEIRYNLWIYGND